MVVLIFIPILLIVLMEKRYLVSSNILFYKIKKRIPCGFVFGILNFLLGAIIGVNIVFWQYFFSPQIKSDWFNQHVVVDAQLTQIPNVSKTNHFYKLSFTAKLNKVAKPFNAKTMNNVNDQAWSFSKPEIKLTWYLDFDEFNTLKTVPKVGETWQFYVKLKSNHASINPGARDYEAWLFQNHLIAKASISGLFINPQNKFVLLNSKPTAIKLRDQSYWNFRVWRQYVAGYLSRLYKESDNQAIYNALLIGDKSQIHDDFWQLFQKTGTIHLMAISGLHMGMMALFGFWVFKGLWWLGFYRQKWFILPTFSAMGAILFATAYLVVSGGAVPTQRAWIMVVAILGFLWIKRRFRPWYALAMAAFLVVLWDSRSLLSTGFWLSFSAVVLIFLSLHLVKDKSKWQQLIAMQLMLSAGLAPLILWNFYEVPFYGLIANLVAVPFVSFLGLPALIFGAFIGLFSTEWAQLYFILVDWLWSKLWWFLQWVADLPKIELVAMQHSWIWLMVVLSLFAGIYRSFVLLQDRYRFSVWYFPPILLFYFAVIVFYPYPLDRPANRLVDKHHQTSNQAWLTVLDVGQGQSIVIETAEHVVVYDTGAKWGETTDAAKAVLLPYLKAKGWQKIDVLIVSHSDIDHAGGTKSVLDNISVTQLLSGQPKEMNKFITRDNLTKGLTYPKFSMCNNNQAWWFDGIHFEILSPYAKSADNTVNQTSQLRSDNDLSCVLKIANSKKSVLITGDLSDKGERILLKSYQHQPTKIQADLLVAGHHGSKYSSSAEFLKVVNPNKVVFSAGYLNRYQFPNQQVLQRIKELNTQKQVSWWNTACSGATSFELSEFGVELRYETRKTLHKWYHHTCLKSQQGTYFQ